MKRNVLIPAVLLLAAAFAVVPTADAQGASFELLPGVVVDRANGRVFAMKPGGGVEAIDARNGRVLFASPLADKPMALWGGLLAAWRENKGTPGRLEVVMIDPARPTRTSTIEVELPADELALVDDTLGRTFSTTSAVRDGALLVGWNATRDWMSPIPPPEGQPSRVEQRGAARLDLTAGRAFTVEPVLLDDAEPLLASTETTAVGDGTSRIVLKRRSADGSALPDVELFRGEAIGQWPSADGRHLLISQRVAPGEVNEYLWNLYSLETGARVGQVRNHFSRAFFAVDGTRLIHDVWPFSHRVNGEMVDIRRQVQAVDLSSGAVLWQRPLRETVYHGPFPP